MRRLSKDKSYCCETSCFASLLRRPTYFRRKHYAEATRTVRYNDETRRSLRPTVSSLSESLMDRKSSVFRFCAPPVRGTTPRKRLHAYDCSGKTLAEHKPTSPTVRRLFHSFRNSEVSFIEVPGHPQTLQNNKFNSYDFLTTPASLLCALQTLSPFATSKIPKALLQVNIFNKQKCEDHRRRYTVRKARPCDRSFIITQCEGNRLGPATDTASGRSFAFTKLTTTTCNVLKDAARAYSLKVRLCAYSDPRAELRRFAFRLYSGIVGATVIGYGDVSAVPISHPPLMKTRGVGVPKRTRSQSAKSVSNASITRSHCAGPRN